jgi:hypothetical protein
VRFFSRQHPAKHNSSRAKALFSDEGTLAAGTIC